MTLTVEDEAPSDAPGASVVAVRSPRRLVVLSYDDGPAQNSTEALLDVLARQQATATFFVLLRRARQHRQLLSALRAGGHEIALHGTFDHRRLADHDPLALPAELTRARDELEQLSGVQVRWFRPPYGQQNARTWAATCHAGLVPVLWTFDCQDWRIDTDHLAIVRAELRPGAIVLLHDGFADLDDGVDDGPAPPLDRARLCGLVLAECSARGLVARSLGAAVTGGAELVQRVWLDRSGAVVR